MVERLVNDMLRRTPARHLAVLWLALVWMWHPLASRGRTSIAMAISMAFSYMLGPVVMLERLRTPLIGYLPVSRRDVWRATWLMSTIAPAALIAAATLAALLTGAAVTWSSLTLSAAMSLLYAGSGCALVAAGPARGGRGYLRIAALVLLLVGLTLPVAVREWLPLEWAELQRAHLMLLAAAVALTSWSAFHTPPVSSARPFRLRARSSTAAVGPVPRERISGLPRLVVHEFGWSLIVGATVLFTMLGMTYVFDGWMGRRMPLRDSLADLLLVFDSRPAGPRLRALDGTVQFAWFGFYAAAVFARFPQLLRHLRVLPLGRLRLHGLLLAWPVLAWSVVWILLALLRWSAIGAATAGGAHVSMLFACVGLSALGIATGLRFTWGPMAAPAVTLPLLMPVWRMAGMSSIWLLAIGTLAFLVAAALNVHSLSRGATYRRPDLLAARAQGR